MRFGKIDFPTELIRAIRDDALVVFAGAGVSMGKPACLPDFEGLANEVAKGSGEERGSNEAIDQFLGRLASDRKIKINEIAARVLSKGNPAPTSLHKHLLQLFKGDIDNVRVVTSNFDQLFESAAAKLFNEHPTVFRASALPRGDEFSGIVHVHGDVTVHSDMVLTDADFGRAYLTGGWARRFLVALFQTSPVLFVGYSHSDPIMEYLARAVPVSPNIPARFILTDDGDTDRWSRLGIKPIEFPKRDFGAQVHSIATLATVVNRGAADWRDFIRNSAKSIPRAMTDEDADVLEFGLTDASDAHTNVRVFVRYAKSFEWVDWLDQRGFLCNLFNHKRFDEKDGLFADWIASNFALQNADGVFSMIGRKQMVLHPRFANCLALRIGAHEKPDISPSILSRWVSILMAMMRDELRRDDYACIKILEKCVEIQLIDEALRILDILIETRVHSDTYDSAFESEVRIGLIGSSMMQVYRALFPHLDNISERLVELATKHLRNQHRQLVAWGRADRDFSQSSGKRERIEVSADDQHASAEDGLIDMARDSLFWLARHKPKHAEVWIDNLAGSDVPILRRLAIATMTELTE